VNYPELFRPEAHATFNPEKMGKSTVFMSERMMVGLNVFEPGRSTPSTPTRTRTRSK